MDSTRQQGGEGMDERLLVPLDGLVGVPVGAPVMLYTDACVLTWKEGTACEVHRNGRLRGAVEVNECALLLDLSPPDPPGSRVDGLSVGLMLLGGEPGCRASIGVNPVRGRVYLDVHRGEWMTEYLVPDVGEPLDGSVSSLRLAVAAVLRSRGSSTRSGEQEVDE